MGNDHIFSFISCENNVLTLLGFSKSEAIFAKNLLFPTQTFTVNQHFFFI
jgi:hypothetical protein